MSRLQFPVDRELSFRQTEQFLRMERCSNKRSSHASDTSSAYSGSDVMQSSIDDQDVDFAGLADCLVDSDVEEGYPESVDVSKCSSSCSLFLFYSPGVAT